MAYNYENSPEETPGPHKDHTLPLTIATGAACSNFYRATRMHSADYAVARCLFVCPSVCPYVRPSHAGILSKRLNIQSQFYRSRVPQPDYSSLSVPNGIVIFRRGRRMQRSMKKRDFRPKSRFISKMIQDRAIVSMESEQKTVPKLSNGAIFNDLE